MPTKRQLEEMAWTRRFIARYLRAFIEDIEDRTINHLHYPILDDNGSLYFIDPEPIHVDVARLIADRFKRLPDSHPKLLALCDVKSVRGSGNRTARGATKFFLDDNLGRAFDTFFFADDAGYRHHWTTKTIPEHIIERLTNEFLDSVISCRTTLRRHCRDELLRNKKRKQKAKRKADKRH